MVKMMASTVHDEDIGSTGYLEIKAKEVQRGDSLAVNCAPDALVLNVEVTRFQAILDIQHANGDEGSLSRNPEEKVKIRKRQAKAS